MRISVRGGDYRFEADIVEIRRIYDRWVRPHGFGVHERWRGSCRLVLS